MSIHTVTYAVTVQIVVDDNNPQAVARLAEKGAAAVGHEAFDQEGDLSNRDGYADLPKGALSVRIGDITEATLATDPF